jgi:hypothetical protein
VSLTIHVLINFERYLLNLRNVRKTSQRAGLELPYVESQWISLPERTWEVASDSNSLGRSFSRRKNRETASDSNSLGTNVPRRRNLDDDGFPGYMACRMDIEKSSMSLFAARFFARE